MDKPVWSLAEALDRLERLRSRCEMDGAYTDAMVCMEALKWLELQRLQLELHEVRKLLWNTEKDVVINDLVRQSGVKIDD
jgi:hypothetical protein